MIFRSGTFAELVLGWQDLEEAGNETPLFVLQEAQSNARSLSLLQGKLATSRTIILMKLSQLILQHLAVGLHGRPSPDSGLTALVSW